jgi:hypothetical protein
MPSDKIQTPPSFAAEPPPLKPPPMAANVPVRNVRHQEPVQSQINLHTLLGELLELLNTAERLDKQRKYPTQIAEIRSGFSEELVVKLQANSLEQPSASILSECLYLIKNQQYNEATEIYKKLSTEPSLYTSIGSKGMINIRRLIKLLEYLQQ